MKALVTGAGGFVGRHLVRHLAECGDEVHETDRSEGGPDLLDAEALEKLFLDLSPDVVYHLAGDADVGGSWDHPVETFRANAEGTLNVLTAARAAGVGRVLAIGSADVYGIVPPEELPITEATPLRPVSPYAASKVAAEYLALQAWLGRDQEVVCVRAFNHVGPGQSERFLAPAVAMRIVRTERAGGDTVTAGNLTPRRDLTDVRDVVRAYRSLVEDGRPGRVYNVCSGTALSVAEICEILIANAERPMRLEADPDLQRAVDLPVLVGDHSLLTRDTGWEPEIPIERSLRELLEECRTRP
jgi:GDP-4-dehydro-6-deoxy-D-mannose reductase